MSNIHGETKSIRSLLANTHFSIDYYQREYLWGEKQVGELIQDLCEKFLDNYADDCPREAVKKFDSYFLGSIIVSEKDGKKFIVDGQQRLTTLTLFLTTIYRNLENLGEKMSIASLICSMEHGRYSFKIDVPERADCMRALFDGTEFTETDMPESVANICARYQYLTECFHKEIPAEALLHFADWLIGNVLLVVITASSDSDAYTIFETMNDRGLSLTPTDMLKGYLLANITDSHHRVNASEVWNKHISTLKKIGKDEDADAIKSWLRSQHANSIRKRERNAKPLDFDLIGTEFHRWIRENENDLGLRKSEDYSRLVERNFAFYAHWYAVIRRAAKKRTADLEAIHYNAQNNFTLQRPALLAPLSPEDGKETILSKLRIVASYIDILIARRIWNWKTTSYSAMQYNIFLLIQSIRGKSVKELAEILRDRINEEESNFSSNQSFRLHGQNGPQVHRLLARMTVFVETESELPSRYDEYVQRGGKNSYEVEHIWANHPERHTDEFSHPSEFAEYRNRIGGLLLLPKPFNQTYGDLPYSKKRDLYLEQNLLAKSLSPGAYQHNPGFKKFREKSGLNFRKHEEFKKADLDARQELYRTIAEQIWNPENLLREAEM